MRVAALLTVLALAACGSRNAATSTGGQQTVRVVSGTGTVTQMSTNIVNVPSVSKLEYPLDAVWRALPAVYESLGISITERNSDAGLLGNPGFKLRRRLGSVPLSRYIDCGNTQGGPNADTYDVHMSVLTELQRDDEGRTLVNTTVEATARPVNFAGEYFRCSTLRSLEKRIVEGITRQMSS